MKTEVLSPAGSYDALVAGVRAGADAVYLGFGSFNARVGAENFDDASLARAVCYCHIRNVKTYITLNTLIGDRERSEVLLCAQKAVRAGVDAIIVQDLGLAALLRRAAPSVPLHASTQLSIHAPAALPLLKEMGFRRVVAAREMSGEDLKTFCTAARRLGLEVETFIYGALCMSVSGQCLLSAALGGRSGNRGRCAQPCRLPFGVQGGTGYDLSLKDADLLPHVRALMDMGVASLKIEGRMKRPEYVAAATAACRRAVDGEPIGAQLEASLRGVFSRSGFTDGYFTGKIGREMFGVRTRENVEQSKAVQNSLHALYRHERQIVPVDGTLTHTGGRLTFVLTDGEHRALAQTDAPDATAADWSSCTRKLERLGGTPYIMRSLTCSGPPLAVPAGILSALRKRAADVLSAARGAPRAALWRTPELNRKADGAYAVKQTRCAPLLVARFETPAQMPLEPVPGLAAAVLPVEHIDGMSCSVPLLAELPRGMLGTQKQVRERLEQAKSFVRGAVCGNLASVALARDAGLPPVFDIGMNLYNSDALCAAASLGAAGAVLSAELSLEAAKACQGPVPRGVFAYGHLPLMLVRNCPGKNGRGCRACKGACALTDRRGNTFDVTCRNGFSKVYNPYPVWLADRLPSLQGLDFLYLYFTKESEKTCAEILRAYRSGGAPPDAFTRGLSERGVL